MSRRSGRSVGKQCFHAIALMGLAMAALRVHAEPPGGNEVALSPGNCPVVHDGDIAIFEWNPAFEPAVPLAEMENFYLYFTAPLEQRTSRSGTVLELRLRPQRSTTPVENSLEDLHNGYFRMRFRVNASTLAGGEYHLASSAVAVKMPADVSGAHTAMLNDPSHSAFCVTLAVTAKEEMKGKRSRSD